MKKTLLLTAALAGFACSASAGVVLSQNRANFESQFAGAYTVETFTSDSHFPISTGVLNSSTNLPGIGITPGLIKAGVTYSTPISTGFFFNIDAGAGFNGGFLDNTYTNALLTVTFDNAVSAFGFDTNQFMRNVDVVLRYDDNSSEAFHGIATSMSFFGFNNDQGHKIKSAVIGSLQNGTFKFALDNFTFGNRGEPAPAIHVPEPSSLLLLVAALSGAALARRRKA